MTIDECLRLVVMRKVINGIGEEEKIALKLFKYIKKFTITTTFVFINVLLLNSNPLDFLNILIRIRVMSKIIFFNRA